MLTDAQLSSVTDLVTEVAATEIMSRFRRLEAGDVRAKTTASDLVTVADTRAEAALARGLTAILPGSTVVGEESVAGDPRILDRLAGEAPVWVVDPIDGTSNFVDGLARFAVLVALVDGGRVVASWTHAPAMGLWATARRGHGVLLDGRSPAPADLAAPPVEVPDLRTSHLRRWPDGHHDLLARLTSHFPAVAHFSPSGLLWVDLVRGTADAAVLPWDKPWDHAAGLLMLEEIGGVTSDRHGRPFSLTGDHELPIVAARDPRVAERILQVVHPPEG